MLAALRTRSQIVLRSGSAAAGATASTTASTASTTASGTTGTGISPPPSSPIQLDPQEDQLCRLLINVTRHLSATRPDLPPVTLRIAGGWLLGLASHDIDVAIDSMMGFDFAQHLHDYVYLVAKEPTLLGHRGNIARIKPNPERSKHLETATVQICGLEVDFVNLRNEVYTAGSRIPVVTFGTPLQDARRRDLTINALFYNLHTRQVEDFLTRGIDDLRAGLIRTPLPPLETFIDDPLRVLRAVRFSTRLDYRIDAEIVEAARRPDIQRLLGEVVSKERVGEEVRKMLGGPRPLQSVCALVQEFRIYHCLFAPHNHFGSIDTTTMTMTKEKNTVEAADGSSVELDYSTVVPLARALETLALQWPHIGEFLPPGVTDFPTEAQRQLFMAAVFYPTRGAQHPAHRQRLSFELPKEALKLSLHDAAVVSTLIESVPSIDALLVEVDDARHDMKEYRLRVGTMIRTIGRTLKEWYPLAVLFAAAHAKARVELSAAVSATAAMSQAATLASPVDTSTCKVPTTASEQEGSISNIYLQPYVQLMHDINRLRLSNVHDERPLLDGDALVALVREYRATRGQSTDVKVGRWVGQVHELIIEWQLREGPIDDESMTCNAEACRRFIVELLDAGRIDVDEPSYKKNKSKTKAVTTAATPSTTATSKH